MRTPKWKAITSEMIKNKYFSLVIVIITTAVIVAEVLLLMLKDPLQLK